MAGARGSGPDEGQPGWARGGAGPLGEPGRESGDVERSGGHEVLELRFRQAPIDVPASNFMSKGVIKGAINVAIAVTATESTKFALAMYTITLEANPLEQEPIKMIPAAISVSK